MVSKKSTSQKILTPAQKRLEARNRSRLKLLKQLSEYEERRQAVYDKLQKNAKVGLVLLIQIERYSQTEEINSYATYYDYKIYSFKKYNYYFTNGSYEKIIYPTRFYKAKTMWYVNEARDNTYNFMLQHKSGFYSQELYIKLSKLVAQFNMKIPSEDLIDRAVKRLDNLAIKNNLEVYKI